MKTVLMLVLACVPLVSIVVVAGSQYGYEKPGKTAITTTFNVDAR